eukprot:Gb_10006 [translate_table: standard]
MVPSAGQKLMPNGNSLWVIADEMMTSIAMVLSVTKWLKAKFISDMQAEASFLRINFVIYDLLECLKGSLAIKFEVIYCNLLY